MPKEASAVKRIEEGEAVADGVLEGLECARRALAQVALEFAEGQLDRVEVGAVGRQEAQARAALEDQTLNDGRLVDAKVVEDDDVARSEFWTEDLFHIGLEDIHVG